MSSDRIFSKCVRITQNGKSRNYISFLQDQLLSNLNDNGEENIRDGTQNSFDACSVTFFGSGPAITKVVSIAETLKRLVAGLHQITEISSIRNPDENKLVSTMTVILSKNPPEDQTHYGYQPPNTSQ